MKYKNIHKGTFISRQNRFIATVNINGKAETAHVKNTGRCRELFVPGATVFLEESDNPNRKTKYDLVAVNKGKRMVNVDSQIPNGVVEEWIRTGRFLPGIRFLKREVVYGNSRFDLYVEYMGLDGTIKKAFIEVKGVTLEEQNVVRFPDAPTERGIKHIKELIKCLEDGYEAYLLFVIQMKDVDYFEPDKKIHPEFAGVLKEAKEKGVCVLAYDSYVTEDSIEIGEAVPVEI